MAISSTIRTEFINRTAFRLASVSAAVTALLMLALFSGLFLKFRQDLRESLKTHVDEVSSTLADLYHAQGRVALADVVARRSFVGKDEEDLFLLTDASGVRLAGNLGSMPRFDGWRFLQWDQLDLKDHWPGERPTTGILGKWTALGDSYLFVGDGNRQIRAATQLLFDALCVGVLISFTAAAIGGAWLGLKTQKRIDAMESVLLKVASGELRERIPLSDETDDINKVGALVNSMLDRFEALVTQLRDVSTAIAHDLRNPISRLRNKFEMMRQDANIGSSLDETLEEFDSIASTFDSLLRIAEVESGSRRRDFADVDLVSVVQTVMDALEAVAEEKGHVLEFKLAAPEVLVYGDRQLLCQLLMNLVENSIQHCPNGSHISVVLKVSGERAQLSVKDDGPGIPIEQRDRVFQRLYRLDRSRGTPGSGLGLSLVAAIADLHRGKVTICDDGPGLCVCVILDLLSRQAATA